MKQILKKHIIIFIIALTCFFAVVIGFVFLFKKFNQMFNQVNSSKERLVSFEENKKIFSEESKDLDNIKNKTDSLEKYIITQATVPNLLSSFESLAKNNNLDFSISSVVAPDINYPESKFSIGFMAKGKEEDIAKFLFLLEHQTYQINFVQFLLKHNISLEKVVGNEKKFEVVTNQENPTELTASIQIISY